MAGHVIGCMHTSKLDNRYGTIVIKYWQPVIKFKIILTDTICRIVLELERVHPFFFFQKEEKQKEKKEDDLWQSANKNGLSLNVKGWLIL